MVKYTEFGNFRLPTTQNKIRLPVERPVLSSSCDDPKTRPTARLLKAASVAGDPAAAAQVLAEMSERGLKKGAVSARLAGYVF